MVGGVAEAVGVAGFEFDQPVDALACGVGRAGVQEGLDLGPPGLDGAGEDGQFGDVAVGASAVEVPQSLGDLVAGGVGATDTAKSESDHVMALSDSWG